ncbi:MAG: antitoxin family protein [Deltaproteobacteria bacterium]|nr:antitoxin family protein [Deltaproteobacteria bacterium]
MEKTVEAIYEGGVFKPIKHLTISEHERFKLTITPIAEDEKETKKVVGRQREALLAIAGVADSGLSDVSKNHDKYLYGKPCGTK